MDNLFTIEETNLLCIFQSDSKEKVIEEIHKSMKHIDDDELVKLSVRQNVILRDVIAGYI